MPWSPALAEVRSRARRRRPPAHARHAAPAPALAHRRRRSALAALLAFAFDALALHRVEADVDPRNVASACARERAGFVRAGRPRERHHLAGEVRDAVRYGLLRRDRTPRAARP